MRLGIGGGSRLLRGGASIGAVASGVVRALDPSRSQVAPAAVADWSACSFCLRFTLWRRLSSCRRSVLVVLAISYIGKGIGG